MLKIKLRPSWLLAGVLTLAHGGAVAVMWCIDVRPWFAASASIILLVHLVVVLRARALLLTAGAVVALEVSSDNVLSVQTRETDWREFEVLGTTFVMPCLTILNLRPHAGGPVQRVVILPDSLHMEDFRKLRVWLRWKENAAPG